MKFSIQDIFSKCSQIRSYLRMKKSLMEIYILCAVWPRILSSAYIFKTHFQFHIV